MAIRQKQMAKGQQIFAKVKINFYYCNLIALIK